MSGITSLTSTIGALGSVIATGIPWLIGLSAAAILVSAALGAAAGNAARMRAETEAQTEAISDAVAKQKEVISSQQEALSSFNEINAVYSQTENNQAELAASARELADAYNIVGASAALASGDMEAYNEMMRAGIINANNKDLSTMRESLNALLLGTDKKGVFHTSHGTALDEDLGTFEEENNPHATSLYYNLGGFARDRTVDDVVFNTN